MTVSQPGVNAHPTRFGAAVQAALEALNQQLYGLRPPLSQADKGELYEQLQGAWGERGQGFAALAQINTTPGDLEGNARKIMQALTAAEALKLDWVAFPELALMGYSPRDILVRYPFLVQENLRWLESIARQTGDTYALVGFVEPRSTSTFTPSSAHKRIGRSYFNSVAVLGEGRIQAIVRKSLLATYNEFDEVRQFESGVQEQLDTADWIQGDPPPVAEHGIVTIHGRRYGLSICEDLWNDSDFFNTPLYHYDPIALLAHQKPDALLNLSASPTRSHKEQIKHQLCAHVARKYEVPLVYVNQVGTVDEVSFDGVSRAYDAQGQLFARGKAFQEQLMVLNPFTAEGWIEPLPLGLEPSSSAQPSPTWFDVDDASDLGRTYESLCQGIRDYFQKNGFQRAVIGVSGGLDSSVTLVLLVEALGAENVLAVSMPSELTPDDNRTDAFLLANHLGVSCVEIPIGEMTGCIVRGVASVYNAVVARWGEQDARSNATDNVQAITRATLLRQLGNEFRAFPVATSDKSEFYLGYATVNGDMSGALAPLGDLPKTKVRALARWINRERASILKSVVSHSPKATGEPIIPERILEKPSGADLKTDPTTGALITAEQDLMPYEFADEVIWRLEALHQSLPDMQNTPFQYEARHPLSPEQKTAWLNKFFDRMAKAVFKWFIAPPILIVEGSGSIAKTDYHHPIVANRICWQGHSEAQRQDTLNQATASIVG